VILSSRSQIPRKLKSLCRRTACVKRRGSREICIQRKKAFWELKAFEVSKKAVLDEISHQSGQNKIIFVSVHLKTRLKIHFRP